jgi:hypothetical protein
MSKCPNSDPSFDKFLARFVDTRGGDYPAKRRQIFYTVCIVVRLILYSSVFLIKDQWWMPILIGMFAMIALVGLLPSISNPGNQWWSKRFQLGISITLVIACILTYFKKIETVFVPVILMGSLVGGVAQSLMVKFC